MGRRIHQMDAKVAFLNGITKEEVYIEQPQGFEVNGKELYVCRLKKVLYGIKQTLTACMDIHRVWAPSKVKQILTYIIYYLNSSQIQIKNISRAAKSPAKPEILHTRF